MLRQLSGVQAGSSPRGRGKLITVSVFMVSVRLIPARAGKTRRATTIGSHAGAHPRAGGENARMSEAEQDRVGSSPRGRGKLRA